MQPLLLDTCAAIWIAQGDAISDEASEELGAAYRSGLTTYVSAITAWEIGMLVARQRLKILMLPQRWFDRLIAVPTIRLAEASPEILVASSFLPGTPPKDPADRIIVATAREIGATLVTRDRLLLNYGKQGHLRVLAC